MRREKFKRSAQSTPTELAHFLIISFSGAQCYHAYVALVHITTTLYRDSAAAVGFRTTVRTGLFIRFSSSTGPDRGSTSQDRHVPNVNLVINL
jgi:hypothetical protein